MTTADTFTELFTEQAPRIRRLILADLRTADHADADDLTQDVFLAFWRYLEAGQQIARPAGLLTVMARHRVVDHYRAARAREQATDWADWFEARKLPTSPAAEDIAVERITAVAMLADYAPPLVVAA